ncbi:clathrin associated protein complex large subunit [Coemansia sp. RSA 552]|nr:clathrin associated protein complex large subunit [Coemansia sp. RSA 552]
MSFFRLKDLIRAVRVCKTAADERGVIRRESAAIRTSFREVESQDARYVNVQKLLYIHLLGFPVQFGQLECLKLAASARFADKRVGYLGVALLLDERQDIVTLLTNSLKTDLCSEDDYIVGLALATLASVATADVARDLADEVLRLTSSPRAYIRKKAGLAAVRVVRRSPDLGAEFVDVAGSLANDKHHGAALAGAALVDALCLGSADALEQARALVPALARRLRSLARADAGSEHGVGGTSDPFLQVALLRLLRTLARASQSATDDLNDVLTLVATRTDATRNAGAAILYECAATVLAVPSDPPLRVLAINLLGRFLAETDNNARYVALASLAAAVITEAPSVQRHRATVVACMGDPDPSIRRRAIDLAFALINPETAKVLVHDILRILPTADAELVPSIVYRLAAAISLFADSPAWHVERMLRVLSVAGTHLNFRDLFKFIRLVATADDTALQRRAARCCYALLRRDVSQDKMVIAGVWIIGEYGDLLVPSAEPAIEADSTAEPGLDADDLDILGALGKPVRSDAAAATSQSPAALDLDADLPETTPEPSEAVDLLACILRAPQVSATGRRVALTALAKLAGRFADQAPAVVAQIRAELGKLTTSMDAEVQARASEFEALLAGDLDSVRAAVVERMPLPEYKDVPYEEYVLNPTAMRMKALTVIRRPAIQPADLLPDSGDGAVSPTAAAAQAEASKQSVVDDLLNLMDDEPQPQSPVMSQPQSPAPAVNSIADLLSSTSLSPQSPASPPAAVATSSESTEFGPQEVFNQDGLRITMTPSKSPSRPQTVDLAASFFNEGDAAISDLNFLVAVPRSQKIQIHPPSGRHISVGASVSQLLRITNPSASAIRLRMKISFSAGSQAHEATLDFGGFPKDVV